MVKIVKKNYFKTFLNHFFFSSLDTVTKKRFLDPIDLLSYLKFQTKSMYTMDMFVPLATQSMAWLMMRSLDGSTQPLTVCENSLHRISYQNIYTKTC